MLVVLEGTQAHAVDVDHWGLNAEGRNEDDALEMLASVAHDRFEAFHRAHGAMCASPGDVEVVERTSDIGEGTFAFDRLPATAEERERTIELHGWARADLVTMIAGATEAELDWDAPERTLPYGWWRTARGMAWHCLITETRYYLGRLGVEPPEPFATLQDPFLFPATSRLLELCEVAADHVRRSVLSIAADLDVSADEERWTTRKALRRLAAHEREENDVTRWLLARARLEVRAHS